MAGCGSKPRDQPALAKTWSLLAAQPKRLITKNVNIGLAPLAPNQGPNLVKTLGQTSRADRPTLEPVPSDRGGNSEPSPPRISAPTGSTDVGSANGGFEAPTKFLSELRNNSATQGEPSFVATAPVSVAALPPAGSAPSSSFGAFITRPTSSGLGSGSSAGGGGLGGTASSSAAAPISSSSNRILAAPILSSAPSSTIPPPSAPAIGSGTGIALVSNPPPAGGTTGNEGPPANGGENPSGEGQGATGENAKPNPGTEEPPPAQPGTGGQGEGELRSTSQALVASNAGTLGSQPEVYNMGNEMIIPTMVLMFNDAKENVQEWTYNLDPGQEIFPGTATIKEGFFSQYEGLLCAPDPKGCQGRFLRWFDLGVVPNVGSDPRGYLAAFHLGKLKREQINTMISYIDVPIGAGNLIKMPPIAAKVGHVYTVVLAPAAVPMTVHTRIQSAIVPLEGSSVAVGVMPIEMNLDDPIQYELLKSYTMSKDYNFARGILVKGVGPTLYYIDSNPAVFKSAPTVVPLPGVQTFDPNSLILNRTTPAFQGGSK